MNDFDPALAEPQGHAVLEGESRPRHARRHAFDTTKEAREATDLARLVLLAALDDQFAGGLAGDDLGGVKCRRAEHADSMIVRQQHVLDRFVGDGFHPGDDVARHQRCRLRIDDHAAVVANDDAGIGIAFSGVGVEAVAQRGEGDGFLAGVGGRGEAGGGHGVLQRQWVSVGRSGLWGRDGARQPGWPSTRAWS